MAFSTIKNKFWWGGGVVFRNRKWCFWRIWDMFSASKKWKIPILSPLFSHFVVPKWWRVTYLS